MNAKINFIQAKDNFSDLIGIKLKASEARLNLGKNITILGLNIEFV